MPLFAAPSLSIAQAYGPVLVVSAFRSRTASTNTDGFWKNVLLLPIGCGLSLLAGYVLFHWFIA